MSPRTKAWLFAIISFPFYIIAGPLIGLFLWWTDWNDYVEWATTWGNA